MLAIRSATVRGAEPAIELTINVRMSHALPREAIRTKPRSTGASVSSVGAAPSWLCVATEVHEGISSGWTLLPAMNPGFSVADDEAREA